MDGTYNNPFAHNQSPLSPDTPTSASYQVNINRKKTRKWVEAKVQNYDGDDWGTDEYDDDDEPPPPPVPRVTTGLRPAGQRLPSESKPSARLVAAAAAGSARSASGPPSLRLQTQQSSTAPASSSSNQTPVSTTQSGPAPSSTFPTNEQKTSTSSNSTPRSQGPVQDVISPVSARTNSPAPVGARFPLRKSSIGQQNAPETLPAGQLASAASSVRSGHSAAIPRTASPAGRSTPDRSSPLVRPSELHRQDRSSTNSPHPSVDSSLTKPSVRSVSPMEEPARPAPSDKDEEKTRLATQPTLDSIAERKSEHGLDKFSTSSQSTKPADVSESKIDNKPLGDEIDEERKRMSVSPQLPDVARMSFFGPDLFSSATKDFSNAPPVPQAPVQQSTKQEPSTTVAQPAPGTSSPSADRSHTSTPQSLPVSSVAPSSMERPEPSKPESNPSSSVYNTRSGTPSDARSPVGSMPLSVNTRTDSQRGGISPVSDQASDETANSATDNKNQKPNLQPTSDVHSVPPLRTPSPNAKGPVSTVSSHDDSARQSPSVAVSDLSSSSHVPTANITPTEPLRPRQADQSPIDFEPRPMQREPTISTVASSPVKESDVLSDEIMKSLSPVTSVPTLAPPAGNDGNSLAPGPRGDLRSSTYTLSGYDDYWADTTDKPDSKEAREDEDATPMPVPDPMKKSTEQPSLSLNTYEATTVTPNEPTQDNKSATGTQDRRRFSWEASFDDKPKEPLTQPPADSSPKIPSIHSPSPVGQSDIQSPKDFVSDLTSPGSQSHNGTEPPSLVIPTSGGISHQVSKASTAHPSQQPAHMLEPPSPISVTSERHDPIPAENRPVSLLQEDKQSSHTPTTPPPDDRPLSIPGYAPPPYQLRHEPAAPTKPLLAMRDIMNMQSPADRLAKYDETRQAYAAMDPGLQNWIMAVKGQYPEHASATSNFNGGLPVSRQGLHTPTASGSHPPSQQPYYQQYLNASSPSVNAPGGSGQSRLGRLPGSSPGTSSTFGNSSNQIGSKSKEFMHSAGKMGKGLLSKGKSKLRGTGEKGEPIPPPTVHPKVKSERRTSWSLSLSSRSRTDGPATHSNKEMIVTNAPVQPPQLAQPAPVSPLESTSQINDPFQQHHPQDQGPRNIRDESDELAFVDSNHDDPHRWEIPTPVSKDNTPWDPFNDAKISNEDDSDVDEHSGVKLGDRDQPKVDTSKATASPRVSEEWVVVPEQSQSQQEVTQHTMPQQTIPQQNQIRMVTPEPPSAPPHMTPTQGDVTPRATVDPTKQRLMDEETPKRNSSFIGLPPIRRGSTFGLSNKPKPTSERSPIDDDDEDDRESSRVSEASTNEKGVDLNSIESSSIDSESVTQQGVIPGHVAPTDAPLGQQQPVQGQMLQHQPQQMHPGGNGPFSPQPFPQQQPGQQPLQQPGQQQFIQQQPVASGALPLIPPHLMSDQQMKKPPSAGWSLQESQISVPLKDPVVRSRAGTGPSQQPHQKPFYGFDKETGLPNPPPSGPPTMAPTSPIKQQKRNADVPPSSTRRYPDLFSRPPPGGGPQQFPPNPNMPPGQQFPGQFSREGSFQRPGTGGQEASGHEERGRSRASGIFKDIGSRFRRASTERRSSFADPRAGHGGPRPDDASEASIATEDPKDRKKRRSSFLLGRQGRPSLDQTRPGSDVGAPQPSPALHPENSSMGAPVRPQNERRSSLFAGGIGALTGRHHKGEHNGPPQSAASSIVNEPAPGTGKVPLKKRFSGFGAKAGVTGVFHRSSQDPIQKPGTPHSLRSEISAPPPGPPQQQGPPQQYGPPQKQGPPHQGPPQQDLPPQGPPHQGQSPQQGPPRQYGPPQLYGPPQKQGPLQQGPPPQGPPHQGQGPPQQGPPRLYGPPQQHGPPQQYGPLQKQGSPQLGPPQLGSQRIGSPQQGPPPQGPPNAMHPPLVPPHSAPNSAAGPAPYGPPNVANNAPPEKEKRKRRGSAAGLISGLLGHKPRDQSPATPPEGRQPMLRRMTGSSSLLDLDSSAHTSQDRPASGNRPSPELTRSTIDPMLGSVSPGKQPPPLLSQQSRPSPLRQGTPVMQDEPFQAPPQQTNSPRAPSTPRQPIQPNSPRAPASPVAAHQNSPRGPPHVSPIGTGSPRNYPKPPFTGSPRLGSPRLANESENAPPGSPQAQRMPPSTRSPRTEAGSPPTLSNAAPAVSGNERGRIVSSPPGDPAARPGQFSPTPSENTRQSLDSSVQLSTDPREFQKVGGFSPDFSRKPGIPSEASQATSVNQDLPQSPVSQISKAEIPSVASSVKGQSPRLGTSVTHMSEQFGRNQSQPGTPSLSQESQTPPMQHQRQQEEQRQIQQHIPPQQQQQQQQRQSQQLPRQEPPPQQQQEQQQPSSQLPRQESFGTVMSNAQQHQQQQRPQSIQQWPPSGYQIAPGTQQSPGLPIPHSTVQPFPNQSSQNSPRPSLQMSNSMPPQNFLRNTMPPPGQPQPQPPMNGPPRTDSPGSKWTGLRNRISSQASNLGSQPPPQGKHGGEGKSSTSKLLSAFKRSSKQPEPRQQGQMHPINMQGPPGGQPFPQGPPRMQQPPTQQQFMQQQQHNQQHPQQQRPMQQSPPPNAQVQQRQSPPMHSPVTGQQPFLQPVRSNSNAFGLPPPPSQGQPVIGPRPIIQDALRQQKPAPQRSQEPQYDQVPIPRGYQAVRGEGMSVPSQYNVGRPMYQAYQQQPVNMGQFPPQQFRPQQFQPQQMNPGMPRQMSFPQILQQQQQIKAPPTMDRRSTDVPGARGPEGQLGQTSPPLRGTSFEVNQQTRPDAPRVASEDNQQNNRMNMGPRSVSSPLQNLGPVTQNNQTGPAPRHADPLRSHPSMQNLVAPQPAPEGDSSQAQTNASPPAAPPAAPREQEQPKEQQPRESGVMLIQSDSAPKLDEPRAVSSSPPVEQNRAVSPNTNLKTQSMTPPGEPAKDLDIAVDKGRSPSPASPPIEPTEFAKHRRGLSQEEFYTPAQEKEELIPPVRSPAQEEDAHAELEDTQEAHKRKLRIDSQEEKIHYDPNADSDGEVPPQMSATSYPGQEWNPYGMPEFGEWQE